MLPVRRLAPARLRISGWIPCWLALLWLVVPAAAAQAPRHLPRVVLDPAESLVPATLDDLSSLPAAWRVSLALDPAATDASLTAAFDSRAPRGDVWLALRVAPLTPDVVPSVAMRVRDLVRARPAIRVVEFDTGTTEPRVADFFVRQVAVEVRAARDGVAVALAAPGGATDVDRLADAGLAPLIDVLVLPPTTDPVEVRARAAARGSAHLTARLDHRLTGADAAVALARMEIDRLGGPLDISGYLVENTDVAARATAVVRGLQRVLAQEMTPVDADLRITSEDEDASVHSRARVLFGVASLATVVVLDVPDASASGAITLRLVLPMAGTVVLIDPVRGTERRLPSQRDEEAQATTVTVTVPSAGRWLIDFNRDADASFVQREDVTAARTLTLDEILARHQLRQATDRQAVQRYIADGTMQQYFRPTVTDPGFDVFTENRYYVDREGMEWEELSFSVNGARWDENRPPFPLLQPEKVLSPPLVIELDARYRYRLAGTERVNGIACYVVRFEPTDDERSLYRGTVWIAMDTFARVRQEVAQTNLTAPVVSNDETQTFAPVRLAGGREVFLPSRIYNQQLVLIAGRNLLVERRMTFDNYVLDPADFDARRLEARRSDRIMYRDTDEGVRDYVKDGDTRVVSTRSTTRAKAQAIGVTIDPSYDFPLPMLGINYLNFEFMGRKDTQLAVLFAGVLAAGNLQRPQIIGRRIDLNVDFFAIAPPASDRLYAPDGEREGERLLTWPLSTGINLGFQATTHQKITAQYQFRFDGYVRDRTTLEDYTTPTSTVTNGVGLLYEFRRGGYNVTASGLLARRAAWRPWGTAGALEASSPGYEKYALNATKTIFFGPFSKVVVNGAWFTGRRLDRFSRYQFGLFDETRIRGVPSSGVRYGELAMARGQYSFNIFEQYRLDLFLDRAWGRTREAGVPWEGLTGIGAAINVRIPGRNLILRADVGKSFLPDRYRRLGSMVVQILFLRPLS
jgi:hypothetical protein